MNNKRNIVIGITGASGSIYARLLCERLASVEEVGEIALLSTENGEKVASFEDQTGWMNAPRYRRYPNDDLFSAPASGSAPYHGMVVIPCSMGMLGRIAHGISNDLISRTADVMLKERHPLILVTREAPLSTLHLRNMTTLSECGGIICPASPSFYAHPTTIDALCGSTVERVIALLGLDAPHYTWGTTPR